MFANTSYASIHDNSKYKIICGIAQPSANTFKIIKVTTDIPFITKNQNPNYFVGCTVNVNDINVSKETKFALHAIITIPISKLDTYKSNVGYSQKQVNGSSVYKTETVTFTKIGSFNTGYAVFRFDDSDPIGDYLVDIYVNNVAEKQVLFNVKN